MLSFEIHTLKDGKWLIDQIDSTREEAVEHAKVIFSEDHKLDAVKVVEELYNANTNTSQEKVIFNDQRNSKGDKYTLSRAIKANVRHKKNRAQSTADTTGEYDYYFDTHEEPLNISGKFLLWMILLALGVGMSLRWMADTRIISPFWEGLF